ncbi:hypothetical protein SLS58_004072 [Diplodia intermedia]|uniref:Heterokaryon incompatibility domain-containing protein n=1 Tax=Diplodia intermedia TaxID=856260 RepID=A0ABR3TVB8_9PEZI
MVASHLLAPHMPNHAPTHPDPSRIGLIETASHPAFTSRTPNTTTPPPYCTLSHSWGPTPRFLRLRAGNIAAFLRDGVAVAALGNRTFAHAVDACRRLGVRFLWIDSLCIVQRWGEAEAPPADAAERALEEADWGREAPVMHAVYRGSWCNIAAADAGDAGERLLSPRLLHYTRHQLYFDCATLSACETFPHGLPAALDSGASSSASTDRHWRARLLQTLPSSSPSLHAIISRPLAPASAVSLEQFWATAVASYTRCALTRAADRGVALWGVAKPLLDMMLQEGGGEGNEEDEEAYAVGLWRRGLEEQLAWRLVGSPGPLLGLNDNAAAAATTTTTTTTHHGTNVKASAAVQDPPAFPSWSWMAVVDAAARPVEVADRLPGRRTYTVAGHDDDGAAPVRFELAADGFRRRRRRGGRKAFGTWKEQFGVWDRRMEETAAAVAMRKKSGRGESERGNGAAGGKMRVVGEEEEGEEDEDEDEDEDEEQRFRDEHPRLASNSIALYGHVGRARCVYDAATEDYRLEIPGGAAAEEDGRCRVEVFPDFAIAHGEMVYFMILAATVEKDESEWGGNDEDEYDGYDDENDEGEDQEESSMTEQKESETGVEDADEVETAAENGSERAANDFDAPCHGVGIILHPGEGDNHFYRLGALRFDMTRGIMESTYLGADSEDLKGCDGENKYKIWLD